MRSLLSVTLGLVQVSLLVASGAARGDEPKAATEKSSYQVEFSGKDYVVIPTLRYDGTHPITLEGLFTPYPDDVSVKRCCVLGNVQLAGLALARKDFGWRFNFNDGREETLGYAQTDSTDKPVVNKQVHVAGVCDGKQIFIFVDGKLQPNPRTLLNPHKASPFDFMVGADPDGEGGAHQFFTGAIDEVRISKVVRYKVDFKPSKDKFKSDEDTLVLYHFDEGEGEVAKDSSSNKYDGKLVGAKWVKAAD